MTTSDPGSPAIATAPGLALDRSRPVSANPTTAVFGQVMGLVAATIAFLAAGAYIGRDLNPGLGIVFFLGAFACIFGLNVASSRGSRQLASTLLFGVGLLLGLALGPVLSAYAHVDPAALWQAAGATAASVAALGALGYAVRRDLSSWARTLLWALDRLRDRGNLRLNSPRECHLRRRRARDLRRLHGVRFQSAAPHRCAGRDSDRSEHLPRYLQRVPAVPAAVRRRAGLTRSCQRN
jgi:inhibitor of apoptosis-promoting Bax1